MRRDDICLYLGPADRAELQAMIANRNTARKLVWRAEIVLVKADDHHTSLSRLSVGEPLGFRAEPEIDGSSACLILSPAPEVYAHIPQVNR